MAKQEQPERLKLMYNFGMVYGSSSDNGGPLLPKQSIFWLKKAAQEGYLPALHALGWIYYEGRGTNRDLKKAEKYFRFAAEHGYADSQYMLGILYISEETFKKDSALALQWIKRAADQGHPEASNVLKNLFQSISKRSSNERSVPTKN